MGVQLGHGILMCIRITWGSYKSYRCPGFNQEFKVITIKKCSVSYSLISFLCNKKVGGL